MGSDSVYLARPSIIQRRKWQLYFSELITNLNTIRNKFRMRFVWKMFIRIGGNLTKKHRKSIKLNISIRDGLPAHPTVALWQF